MLPRISGGLGRWRSYRQGSWTPVLTFATPGNQSIAYSTQIGTYAKVGRVVFAHYFILTSTFTHTTASGNLQVTGLPFTAANDSITSMGGLMWGGITKAGYTDIGSRVNANTNLFEFGSSGSGQTISNVTSADCPSGGSIQLRGSVMYFAAN